MALYVLLNSFDEVVDEIDSITPGGAEYYFMKRKQMSDTESFYKVWKIKTKKEHKLNQEAFKRKPSSEWWNEEEDYLDIDKPQGKNSGPFIVGKRVIKEREESYLHAIKTKNKTV